MDFYGRYFSHTLRGCVDWNVYFDTAPASLPPKSHPSWVCGLKLNINLKFARKILSHTLRGCVDWNTTCRRTFVKSKVTPFVGVWIETGRLEPACCGSQVTPFVGVWIETAFCHVAVSYGSVTPFVGVWIETSWAQCLQVRLRCHTLRGCVDWNIPKTK